jgi:hypothetical protein
VVRDDGTPTKLDIEIQTRIIENMERELQAFAAGSADANEWAYSIGYLASRADLQAELLPKAVAAFAEKYRTLTGMKVTRDTPGLYVLDRDANKWGPELRIYFDATPTQLGTLDFPEFVEVRDGHQANQYRINSNAFFLKLLEWGFVLGPNQDFKRIRTRLPPVLRESFDKGSKA